jgi:transposase InsO family protein/transposase-like protein
MKKYMRFSQDEKAEIIKLVDESDIGVNRTLKELGIPKRTFYDWYARYLADGYDGLATYKAKVRRQTWNKIPREQQNMVVEEALDHTELSSRELAAHIVDNHKWFISESSVYRILKERGLITAPAHIVLAASDEFKEKTVRVNQMWQTDFTYFKIIQHGWYYLITVLDDYSRYIVHWKLCLNMEAEQVKAVIDNAMQLTGLNKYNAPKLLSDNGPCFIANELTKHLNDNGIKSIHGRACHPQTQGKIERYHRTMKNVIKLDNYFFPEELILAVNQFVDYYNNHRYHESLDNLTPADVYFGRARKILQKRQQIKMKTIAERRKNYIKEKMNILLTN